MARFEQDPSRVNYTLEAQGKEYNLRLVTRASGIFTTLLNLLPSNYISTIQGPNYTMELKAVALELARIELSLEDIDTDKSLPTTRSDFLYSVIGYLVLLNGKIPPLAFDDNEFRNFLSSLITIYFQGSTPKSMHDAMKLFYSGDFQIKENFLLVRGGASGLDISDQFGFQIDVITGGVFPTDVFALDSAVRILLDVLRPAHTLFRIRYLFKDAYQPNQPFGKILDAMRWKLQAYWYDDFRKYCAGIQDRDRLGEKTNLSVTDEQHGDDF